MDMYVSNPTKQVIDFQYRIADISSAHWKLSNLRSQKIAIGGQIKISGNLTTDDIELIIKHHSKYGMVSVNDAHKTKKYIPYIYSLDKPIPAPIIEHAVNHNDTVLKLRGMELRKEAAVAESIRLENSLQESGRPEALHSFETSVVEENFKGREDAEPIAEGVRVIRDKTVNKKRR